MKRLTDRVTIIGVIAAGGADSVLAEGCRAVHVPFAMYLAGAIAVGQVVSWWVGRVFDPTRTP